MLMKPIIAAAMAALPFGALAGGNDAGPEPSASCSETTCTVRIRTETSTGPAFTAPLPFTVETDKPEFILLGDLPIEYGVAHRQWNIDEEERDVGIAISDPLLVLGEQVLLVRQGAGFDISRQAHLLFQLTNTGFHEIARFKDGMRLGNASNFRLTDDGFQYLEMFADYGTEKGYSIDEQQVTTSIYVWRRSGGRINAELVSETTTMEPMK